MKYTFIDKRGKQKTVQIDDSWIKKQRTNLGISTQEAIDMWLFDEGYVEDETVDELTAKAAQNKSGIAVRSNVKKERKKPERKPDMVKRDIIQYIYEVLSNCDLVLENAGKLSNVTVTNIERMIAFNAGGDDFEITLTKKRKPKNS